MHGLVSLLPSPYYEKIVAIWEELDQEFGLTGIRVTPYPHFSWQISQDYHFDLVETSIKRIAQETDPFSIHTTGVALFTGANPVLYIPVVKDERLLSLHAKIWAGTKHHRNGCSSLYSPDAWMPHISLAYEDVTAHVLQKLIPEIAFLSFNWEMMIDNISMIFEPDREIGTIKFKINLGEEL